MRMCDLQTGSIRLNRAAKLLRDQWNETSEEWDDANQREFDRAFMQTLSPQIVQMRAAVHRLAEVLQQAERECSDDSE